MSSMGDFVSPKRAVVDRLRRRIETYKRGHKNASNRNHYSFQQQFDNHRQETALLHQKWLEGKAKKAAKNTRVNKDPPNSTNTQTHSQSRLKKPKTDSSTEVKSTCEAHNIEEQVQKEGTRGSAKHSVSVNIEQIIKTPQSSGSHIEIKLKSTVHTSQVDSATTQISTSTNICKEEPQETGNSNPSSNGSLSIGIDDVDELQEILDALEQGSGPLKDFEVDSNFPDSENLKKENSEQILLTTANQSVTQSSISNQEFMPKSNPTSATANTYFDSQQPSSSFPVNKEFSQQQTRSMYATDASQQQFTNMNTQGPASNVGGYNRPQVPMAPNPTGQQIAPSIPSFADTGPAAKTLQQMAAQHQSHLNIPGPYGNDGYIPDARAGITNYSRPGYDSHSGVNGTYSYNQNVNNMPMYMKGHEPEMKAELPVGPMQYGGPTKPLTHYDRSGRPTTGTSIQSQQIHNQDSKGQYSQASTQGGIHVTQSQQITVNPSHSRMNFSQTQQMQVHSNSPHPLTLNQQQSFHMGSTDQQHQSIPPQHMAQQQHMAPATGQQNMPAAAQGMSQTPYISEQMKMQMYHQQEMRSRMQQQQQMQQQQGQFSGRPPPSYQPTSTVPHGGMNSNPLQTMQNMVEQTNQSSSEPSYQGSAKQSNIPGHSLPQSQTSHNNTSVQSSLAAYSNNQSNGPVSSNSNVKAESTNYTSTIMRGQRPPNVNIGPEGLNISQPRLNQWRQMGPSSSHGVGMHRPPTEHNHQMSQYQNYGGHMPSNMYSYRMQMAQQQNMQMVQQHPQRLPMQSNVSNNMGHNVAMQQQMRGPAPMSQSSVAMMMSQQHMQQQMNNSQIVGGNMSHSHQPNAGMPNTGGAGHNPNYSLDFLNHHHHPQSGHLFDHVQNPNPTDFNFDDILEGK